MVGRRDQHAGIVTGPQPAGGQPAAPSAVGDLQRQAHVLLHQQHAGPVAGGELPHHRIGAAVGHDCHPQSRGWHRRARA
jgi:hypothetical protein